MVRKCNLLEAVAPRECALDERLAVAEAVDFFDASVAAGAVRLEGVGDGFENDVEWDARAKPLESAVEIGGRERSWAAFEAKELALDVLAIIFKSKVLHRSHEMPSEATALAATLVANAVACGSGFAFLSATRNAAANTSPAPVGSICSAGAAGKS